MTSLSDSSQEKERHTLGGGPKTWIMSERGGNNVAQDLGEVKKKWQCAKMSERNSAVADCYHDFLRDKHF